MYDDGKKNATDISIWDHVLDGAGTGALGGAAFAGVGAIPGAILGGLVGLGNGLWQSNDEANDKAEFTKATKPEVDALHRKHKNDPKTTAFIDRKVDQERKDSYNDEKAKSWDARSHDAVGTAANLFDLLF